MPKTVSNLRQNSVVYRHISHTGLSKNASLCYQQKSKHCQCAHSTVKPRKKACHVPVKWLCKCTDVTFLSAFCWKISAWIFSRVACLQFMSYIPLRPHHCVKIENEALLKQLGLPSTIIGCFSKSFFKPEEFENSAFTFSCGRKAFVTETELF